MKEECPFCKDKKGLMRIEGVFYAKSADYDNPHQIYLYGCSNCQRVIFYDY